jgi:hypothetical protein
VAEQKEDGFKIIDRRPFTSEGELRKDAVELEEREARIQAAKDEVVASAQPKQAPAAVAAKETPKKSQAFENLVRMIGSNAAMVLGAYADPRTGQPVIDPDAARELIDMLDALHEKTSGNLAPEEDAMLLDLLGKLKMTFVEVNQAMAEQMAQMQAQVKGQKK